MLELVQRLCVEHNLIILETLTLGNVCDGVYKVQNTQGVVMVLKLGTDVRSTAEINMNIKGYRNMCDIGLSEHIPKRYAWSVADDNAYILMEYCGEDFLTMINSSDNPVVAYQELVIELRGMYSKSLGKIKGTHGSYLTQTIVSKIVETYQRYIVPILGNDVNVLSAIEQLSYRLIQDKGKVFCFSNWDFTPEDVYLTEKGLKYSDPHVEVLGIPMIDIGCFAGVARDARNLPGSVEGYRILKQVAIDTAYMLELSQHDGERYFYLGRVLQSFLSARFRLKTEIEHGRKIFYQGVEYLRIVLT